MTSIFSDLVELCIEIFIDDFCALEYFWDNYLTNLEKVLKGYIEKNLAFY